MSSTGSNHTVVSDLVDWFLGRAGDRRQYKRRAGAYHVWWQPPGQGAMPKPGIGLEISPSGLMFILPEQIDGDEFNLVLGIGDAKMPVRVRKARSDQVMHHGKPWNRYMGSFIGIAADHWDRIVRYVNHEPEVKDRRMMQNQEMARQPDDAYRLLPLAIQQKIIKALVDRRRLEPTPPGQTPLLKLFYGGLVKRPGKPPAHRINVHSRVQVNDEMTAYDTRFLVDDEGSVTVE